MKEIWKDVIGYEGLYKVSNLGNVYSCKTKRNLSGGYTIDGYRYVALWKNKIRKNKFVHRLVCEAFISNPENFPLVNHKDENKKNNNVDNLEWCDYQYNATYNDAHIKRGNEIGYHVYAYDNKGELIREYNSAREAERITGVSNGSISQCCNGKAYAANDIVWSYVKLSAHEVKAKFKQYKQNKMISKNVGKYAAKSTSKKVNQYELNGNFIQSFPSAQEAHRQLGFSLSNITTVCRGEARQTHGFVFRYADDERNDAQNDKLDDSLNDKQKSVPND